MPITCSALAPRRLPEAERAAASASLIGREAAAISALPSFSAAKPVLLPWAAISTTTSRPWASRARTRVSFCAWPGSARMAL